MAIERITCEQRHGKGSGWKRRAVYREFLAALFLSLSLSLSVRRRSKLDSGRVYTLRPESPAMSLEGPARPRWREGKAGG